MIKEEKNTKKIHGLVLGGGGARGCYEVGAWQAFRQVGIQFQCVAGTSIGAIVGALYTQQSIEPLVEFVKELKPSNVVADMPDMPENFEEAMNSRGKWFEFLRSYVQKGTDISPLKENLNKMFDYRKFMDSPINYACMTFNVTKMEGEAFYKNDMTEENAVDIIIASASCFPAFPMTKLKNDLYIDGGYEDNLPIRLCEEMGADDYVVIDVHGPGRVRRIDPKLNEKIKYIQPLLTIGNFLDFSETQAMRSLHVGYLETMKYCDQFCGYLFSFQKKSWPKIYMCEKYLELMLGKQFKIPEDIPEKAYNRILGYKPAKLENKYNKHYFYGKLIECLAFEVNMDPVKLYDFDDFLHELDRLLEDLPKPELPDSIRSVHEFLHNRKKEEVLNFFYILLVGNKGRLPLVYEPLKNVFDVQYYLANVWYTLHLYLHQ
ncbi:hypothetical protein C815_01229 [Firmicutes bacterium M10-2]|nr:hypothetical protein C815_01229 [Firmicutes bacterium M10-2]